MADTSSPIPLEYASAGAPPPQPTHHSALAGWAWSAVIIEVAYHASLCAIAYHRSPTWTWMRFHRTVGDPEFFIAIDEALLCVGALLAILALIPPNRKRWAAWWALAANLFSLSAIAGPWALYRA